MTSEETSSLRIRLGREVAGTKVEVLCDNEQQLAEAYGLLARICERITIEELRVRLSRLWVQREGQDVISDGVSESTYRVALSLLRSWPSPKSVSDIQAETNLSQGYISNLLVGRQGNAGDWFVKQGELWNLSVVGINAINVQIAPILLGQLEEGR